MANYLELQTNGSVKTTVGATSNIIESPTLNAGVAIGDFVYWDNSNSRYDKCYLAMAGSAVGIGIVDGDNNIITKGLATGLSGLTPGSDYYADSSTAGAIIIDSSSNVKIGNAKSATELNVDIDVEGSEITSTWPIIIPGEGYYGGGEIGGQTDVVSKLTFSDSTVSASTSNLTQATSGLTGLGDPNTYGYFGGGSTGTIVADVDRITFSNSNISVNGSFLTQARNASSGCGDTNTYGYFAGGNSGGGVIATVDRITFSNSNISVNASSLSLAKQAPAGLGDTDIYGYISGGYTVAAIATVDRITFSNSNISVNASNLSSATYAVAGLGDSSTYGYFAGGFTTGAIRTNSVDRLTFSNSNIAVNSSSLSVATDMANGGVGDSYIYGYFGGGRTGAGILITTIERLTFSNSNIDINTSSLPTPVYTLAALAQEI